MKITPRCIPPDPPPCPLEACGARLGNRSPFILNPLLLLLVFASFTVGQPLNCYAEITNLTDRLLRLFRIFFSGIGGIAQNSFLPPSPLLLRICSPLREMVYSWESDDPVGVLLLLVTVAASTWLQSRSNLVSFINSTSAILANQFLDTSLFSLSFLKWPIILTHKSTLVILFIKFFSFHEDLGSKSLPHVRESGIRKTLLVESGILGFGIRNTALGIRNSTNDWNPESKFH